MLYYQNVLGVVGIAARANTIHCSQVLVGLVAAVYMSHASISALMHSPGNHKPVAEESNALHSALGSLGRLESKVRPRLCFVFAWV